MSALKKVLPSILQKHCCILPDKNADQQYSWSPSQYFDEDSYTPPPRNMKGLSGGRPPQLQLTSPTSAHTCGLAECDHPLDHHFHGDARSPSYLLSPTDSYPLESLHRCSPRSSIHSECMMMPMSLSATDHSISSSTFPRMHYGSGSRDSGGNTSGGRDSRDDGSSSHGGSGKMNRIPANLLDQFEKQMPLHRDGFHTLQYQRTATTTTTTEHRNESPGRIRHLVHSVQKLFTKSHSLEGSSKMNGTKSDSHRDSSRHHHHHHQGHHKHSKRSKSKDRKSEGGGKHRSGGWWSSDDNLDSDSTYRTPSIMSQHPVDHITHCYPDSVHSHLAGDLSLKTSKSNNDVKCSVCESMSMAQEGKFMKRSSWSTLTVSQAKEAYRKSSLNLEKPMIPSDLKPNLRPCSYLQVPQDEWGGYPGGGKDDEIPCRRMRSSSYVKAMGDEESGESDSSPKTSPQKSVRKDALVKAIIRPRELLDSHSSYRLDKINSDMRNYITNFAADLSQNYHLQATREIHPSFALDPSTNYNSPKFRSRNQSYMRAVSTLSQASCVSQVSQVSETEVNGQFESVCESVFSEVESQAMEALDLPGCFRTRSHSYLRAIQAGYSHDDDCIPPMASTVTSTIRSTTDRTYAQDETCLPTHASIHEDLADTTPLTHDDLGCPVRRDRLYYKKNMGAPSAKPVSGPPVSPSLFRSPRSSAPERPSPKAIQASIKESATLAAAISMQWKEEVSAMRRELAELRRDLCKELRAFNNNFNSFTQHYNTWSPQGGNMAPGTRPFKDVGTASAGVKADTKLESEQHRAATADRSTSKTKENKPQVSKVSVGTQARSKVLIRQSTADAAVNCPDEKEDKKGIRRSLPKQLSMDPSILACPQSMYVESAIPLTLDPVLPGPLRGVQPDHNCAAGPFKAKEARDPELPHKVVGSSSPTNTKDPVTIRDAAPHSSKTAFENQHDSFTAPPLVPPQLTDIDIANDSDSHTKQSHTEDKTSLNSEQIDIPKMQLSFPVPIVTVTPPNESENGSEITSDPEIPDISVVDKGQSASQTPTAVYLPQSGLESSVTSDSEETEPKNLNKPLVSSYTNQGVFSVCDAPSIHLDFALPNVLQTDIKCPSIVVSEYFEEDSPSSPTDSETNPEPIVTFPEYPSESTLEQMSSVSAFSSVATQPNTEESESEWPPLPEPLDTTPIYHADLVHFDLVMLTSLDQDDLDSVFMDPEPEPLDFSMSPEDFCIPTYQSDSPSSPLPTSDPGTTCFMEPSENLSSLDSPMEFPLDNTPPNVASKQMHGFAFQQVTVTISPPSSVSPDTSLEIDIEPVSPASDSSLPDPDLLLQEVKGSDDSTAGGPQCLTGSQETVSHLEEIEERIPISPERMSSDQAFLWYRWQRRGRRPESLHRSASVELWSGRYEYNSSEITYVSLSL
uniref:DLG associated protein 2 n=1 Tax=Oryzias sinensis TaxID=183150 RepID=A0A8C7ZY50_9TELE